MKQLQYDEPVRLFSLLSVAQVRNRIHCLSSLLPPSNPANLRPRGHESRPVTSFCQKGFVYK